MNLADLNNYAKYISETPSRFSEISSVILGRMLKKVRV